MIKVMVDKLKFFYLKKRNFVFIFLFVGKMKLEPNYFLLKNCFNNA
ncbi:unknown [[Mannheimia] succiniciproducens MBEL55E]|uniref:Uncharacterized protein n=1 Tax=Mannheimia succiniciproducens (strain KCTC 0769BP / MBEL55E) TaxID=221988 RepID=Q65UE0_MANSM|nr:unknown [[Mannheimia] succiniciproducens MBEL55E]